MIDAQPRNSSAPDYAFIDVILLAYRLGRARYNEQKVALLAAAQVATDALTFLTALENFGVGPRTQLHRFVGEILSSLPYYRAQYPAVLGLHREDETIESFLNNPRALSLVEGVLTVPQQNLLRESYWWFVRNHQPMYVDPKRGNCMGLYSTEPQDNASALERFKDYLTRMQQHKNQRIRSSYEGLPVGIVLAILKRAFL